jgi:hypothetical protein
MVTSRETRSVPGIYAVAGERGTRPGLGGRVGTRNARRGLTAVGLPSSRPFTDLFTASHADGASGGPVAERVCFDGCLTYEGATCGDGDGLLANETMVFDRMVAWDAMARCGLPGLDTPLVRAEALDYAGNAGADESRLPVEPPLSAPDCQADLRVVHLGGGSANVSFAPSFDAERYDIVRGDVGALAPGPSSVDLGTVACLADDITATTTTAAALPAPGSAFFYLSRYEHGPTVAEYGWSSAGEPHRPTAGDCPP